MELWCVGGRLSVEVNGDVVVSWGNGVSEVSGLSDVAVSGS